MLRPLKTREREDGSWLGAFANDFHRRFLSLLSYQFRDFPAIQALSIEESAKLGAQLDSSNTSAPFTKADLDLILTPFDLKRLASYANNMLDYHVILDMIPTLADLYFTGRLRSDIKLNGIQQALLISMGLQRKDLDAISTDLGMPTSQLLAMFIKILRKITSHFESLVSRAIEAEMPKPDSVGVSRENASGAHEVEETMFAPVETNLDDELEEVGNEALMELRLKHRELIDSLPLDQ
jgi:N-acetyltransferase 10